MLVYRVKDGILHVRLGDGSLLPYDKWRSLCLMHKSCCSGCPAKRKVFADAGACDTREDDS